MLEMTTYLCCRDDYYYTRIQRMRVNLFNRFVDNWRNCENIVRTFDFDVLSDHLFANEMQCYNEMQTLNDNKTLINISK
jgi:hypothetical protein